MIYVNSRKQNDTELRRPMHNLHCKKAGKIPSTIVRRQPDGYGKLLPLEVVCNKAA